jgi:hypothetical protein
MSEISKWRDGEDVICDICGKPIYNNEPVKATISHKKGKRHARHYFCDGGTMTIIGSPEPGITEIATYGGK